MYNNSTVYSPVCIQLKFWSCTWYFLHSSTDCHSYNKLPFKQMQKRKGAVVFKAVLQMHALRRVPPWLWSTVFNPNPISLGISCSKKYNLRNLNEVLRGPSAGLIEIHVPALLTAVLRYTLARRASPQYETKPILSAKVAYRIEWLSLNIVNT